LLRNPTSPREERGEVTLQAQFVFATLGGIAVVTNDVALLTQWIDWAFAEMKSSLAKAA